MNYYIIKIIIVYKDHTEQRLFETAYSYSQALRMMKADYGYSKEGYKDKNAIMILGVIKHYKNDKLTSVDSFNLENGYRLVLD